MQPAKDLQSQKDAFSRRLNYLLDLENAPPKGKGRLSYLANQFSVKNQSVRKWLEGKSLPDVYRLVDIARHFRVNLEWLLLGDGSSIASNENKAWPNGERSKFISVPVLIWDDLPNWQEALASSSYDQESQTFWADFDFPSRDGTPPKAYALRITDEEMQPRYQLGSIILVAPHIKPIHKNIVVYWIAEEGRAVCRQLFIEQGKQILRPHQAKFKEYKVGKKDIFCGTARQVFNPIGSC